MRVFWIIKSTDGQHILCRGFALPQKLLKESPVEAAFRSVRRKYNQSLVIFNEQSPGVWRCSIQLKLSGRIKYVLLMIY